MEEPQRGIQQDCENHDPQREDIGFAKALFHTQADKQRGGDQLQNRVQAVQPGHHCRIVLQNEYHEIGEDGGKQPFRAKPAQVHTEMFAEHAQIKGGTHVFRQRQQGAQQPLFRAGIHGFRTLALPAAQPQAGNRDDQDRAIGQPGEEERGGGIFAVQQNELSGNKRGEEVGQLAEDGFIAGEL